MRKTICAIGVLAASSSVASAGAIDRSSQSTAVMFEPGGYVELTYGFLSPNVEGQEPAALGGQKSGEMYNDYRTGSFSIKTELQPGFDLGFIIDKPYGADTAYPLGTGYIAAGTTASLDSTSYTALLRYRFPSNVSVLGGIRYQTLSADAFIPFLTPRPGVTPPYSVVGDEDGAFGYVLGVAWEKPEIAARVSLTYNSKIDYDLDTVETSVFGTVNSKTAVNTPQSVNLEFQSGVAANTLVFGSIRWVEWSDFVIAPPSYSRLSGGVPLVYYNDDTWTYTLGVGYQFNETWSGAISYSHDTSIGGYMLNLGPVDGYDSIGLAVSYTRGQMKFTGAVRYYALGDTQTQIGPYTNTFDGNDAIGIGFRVGYTF
ncbi:MAG: hypothetical protein DI533_03160 [Cereibacter sphaeroides]|uniref:Membrane protein involved in aromatic hydrocarbon degradation n=1 Tax=Cereibacter sphaeroides TaxID=1063 RepID=A0A2W5SJK6_CERSP|nr:MAG: hypothetical protein DI533_03160 [Cereibacter sphaeroides]